MKNLIYLFLPSILLLNCSNDSSSTISSKEDEQAPICNKIPKELTIHSDTRVDNYYWLNDRENPKVIEYLNKENEYTDLKLAKTKSLQEEIFQEIKSKIEEDSEELPYFYNGYYYLSHYEEGKDYAIESRKKGSLDASEEILLNGNELAKNKDYFDLYQSAISPNNKLIAYSIDTISREDYDIYIKNITTGELSNEVIHNTTGHFAWANNNIIYYEVNDPETLRTNRVMKHVIGTSIKDDILVFEEKDDQFNVSVYKTKSEKHIIIHSSSKITSEFRFLTIDSPIKEFTLFTPRIKGLEYDLYHKGDEFFIRTNKDASNFKIMVCKENNTNVNSWEDFIPYNDSILTEYIDVFDNYMVVSERQNGLTQLKVINLNSKEFYYIPFNDPAYFAETDINIEFNTEKLQYFYTSMTTPNSIYEFDMGTKEQILLKQDKIIGGHNPQDYISKRLIATARDGVKIPISIIYKKTTKLDINTPLLQFGYGSYGYNIDPEFSVSRLSLLDRGFVYAIAHIRGSQTLGSEWYENGKFLKKKNTFNDFIDCSKFLIAEGYSSSNNLFAYSRSAGGLLMGAIINSEPELYKGVIAGVPFVDVVTTMLDETIPLTTGEYSEWGNPNDKEFYDYMKSYSPYDNVKAQNYPHLLVTAGLNDPRVPYWEPAKWVAKLRDLKTNDNLLLLKTAMKAGHGGASGRFEDFKDDALFYAFMISLIEEN